MNVALNKKILENWEKSEEITNGNSSVYDGHNGFGFNSCPSTLTIDLTEIIDLVEIRFLLWDGLGNGNNKRDQRKYQYRLLTSQDQQEWTVHYDTGAYGYNGWQLFQFPDKVAARYIRLHALHNTANKHFHVVQIEAYDSDAPKLNCEISNSRIISTSDEIQEDGDGLSVSAKFKSITKEIESLVEKKTIHPELLTSLQAQVRDIESIEKSLLSVRREIITPINRELEKGRRLGKFSVYGFWVGIVGGILAIISLSTSSFFQSRTDTEPVKLSPEIENAITNVLKEKNDEIIRSRYNNERVHIKKIVFAWDRATALHNSDVLRSLYANEVLYNGHLYYTDSLINKLSTLLEKESPETNRRNKTYYQFIDYNMPTPLRVKKFDDMTYIVNVNIKIYRDGSYTNKCILTIKKIDNLWKIVAEDWSAPHMRFNL